MIHVCVRHELAIINHKTKILILHVGVNTVYRTVHILLYDTIAMVGKGLKAPSHDICTMYVPIYIHLSRI